MFWHFLISVTYYQAEQTKMQHVFKFLSKSTEESTLSRLYSFIYTLVLVTVM